MLPCKVLPEFVQSATSDSEQRRDVRLRPTRPHTAFEIPEWCTHIQLPLETSKLGLAEKDGENLEQMLLTPYNKGFPIMAPTNYPIQPVSFCIG